MKRNVLSVLAIVVLSAVLFLMRDYIKTDEEVSLFADSPENTTYLIEGQKVTLKDGLSEVSVENSSTKIVTRYFGNELIIDLDGDGEKDDIALILTQETGGTGTFYYAVAAINREGGFVGSDGYLLGDRITPQPTTASSNERHRNVVVFNYADRVSSEPITAKPSVGKSVYLKLSENNIWGIVIPDFEGESR